MGPTSPTPSLVALVMERVTGLSDMQSSGRALRVGLRRGVTRTFLQGGTTCEQVYISEGSKLTGAKVDGL